MVTMNRACLCSALALAMRMATPKTGAMAFAQAYPSRTIRLSRDAGIYPSKPVVGNASRLYESV